MPENPDLRLNREPLFPAMQRQVLQAGMKDAIKNLVLSIVPGSVKKAILHPVLMKHEQMLQDKMAFGQIAYSQEGEDILLNRIFNFKPQGTYVDIGAHHPRRFSNTYFFYKMGWSGINIDAMPGSMEPFKTERPRDINLELGIGPERSRLRFHIFKEPALNTFDETQARKNQEAGWELAEVREVEVYPLAELLDKHLGGREIDFMSIDVEGFEIHILRSNDWNRFRPAFLLMEDLNFSIHTVSENPQFQFLQSVGYDFYGKLANTLFFKKIR